MTSSREGVWRQKPTAIYETEIVTCSLCGKMIPVKYWVVGQADGSEKIFCGPDCEQLYREYWLPKYGDQPSEKAQERNVELMTTPIPPFTPKKVPEVRTRYRKIVTELPAPDSVPLLETMARYEPRSMLGQPPVIWDHAEGFQVYDHYGNMWLDWTSGVLVANIGHSHPEVRQAILDEVERGLLHTYIFPNEARIRLVEKLVELAPPGLDKALLLTTGSDVTEVALKLARGHGRMVGGEQKIRMISFTNAFHGRSLGAQLMGGIPKLKSWIGPLDESFLQVPFPDGFRCTDTSFELFLQSLENAGVTPETVAGVIVESFQGGGVSFAPVEYMRRLREWCTRHDVVLVCDEVQAGFGRTGKMFAFEHYDIVPDILCCGKAISAGLPMSAVIARSALLDQYGPGEMSTTHSGNPVVARAALANIEVILRERLVEKARSMGELLHADLRQLQVEFRPVIGAVHGKGLVAGIHIVQPGTTDPDSVLAHRIVMECFQRGLLMFAPVGMATVKICPPLIITPDAMQEGLQVLREAFRAATKG